jgi:hypothetical protein
MRSRFMTQSKESALNAQSIPGNRLAKASSPAPDYTTYRRMEACVKAAFPPSLENSLRDMLSGEGKTALKNLAKKRGLTPTRVELRETSGTYISATSEVFQDMLGKDVARVFELHTLKEMEEMQCSECPLYRLEHWKKNVRA